MRASLYPEQRFAKLTNHGSQGKKTRVHGNEAVKSHILAARTVANIVKTSLVGIKPAKSVTLYTLRHENRDREALIKF